jgi:hypothetical protein
LAALKIWHFTESYINHIKLCYFDTRIIYIRTLCIKYIQRRRVHPNRCLQVINFKVTRNCIIVALTFHTLELYVIIKATWILASNYYSIQITLPKVSVGDLLPDDLAGIVSCGVQEELNDFCDALLRHVNLQRYRSHGAGGWDDVSR